MNIRELQQTNEDAAQILAEFEALEIDADVYKQNDGKYHVSIDGMLIAPFSEPEQAVNCLSCMLATAKFILGQDDYHIYYMRHGYENSIGGEV